jgi:protein SCO1/2
MPQRLASLGFRFARVLRCALGGALLALCAAGPSSLLAQQDMHSLAHAAGKATGGDFKLERSGKPVALADFRGKVVTLYFGYTYCPDACPTSLAALGAALEGLKPDEITQIQPIFITFDPARDDARRLDAYAAFFHPSMIGLTGSAREIDAVARRYGVLYEKKKVDTAGGYVIDHSSFIYVIDRQGRLVESVPHGTPPPGIQEALRRALARR